ncbi:hybrid polyketide synthetase [Dothistroma septosporum NZE10]|uniref:Hybrid polyketide synthetase n=1 Tax=Dothistroma septosporum (strain NZE10 / CBS 128990) TaxID=675120 RepID=N1PDU3_DOTSN|nr:hybrid polyketide synthetase [Dothistroma septosporum NZE10]
MPYTNEPIAVVGSGCRFPGGSTNPSRLWSLLQEPRDVLRKIDRFKAENFYNEDGHYHGASNVLHAYLMAEDVKVFDHQFFNIPQSEAEAIDPQQRLLMETVYESLESAGLSISSLSGSNTGVYVGVMCDDFNQIAFGDPEHVPTYAATGTSRSILSNRISYFFNWRGPSMTIDTACSSSLIAVHQAVQVLRSGECPVAIAAGSNLILGPTMFVAESNLNMLSPHGRSRMWDASANGYARGEGVASVVLKTLSAALRDGDHIECIIRETGVNQDGRTPGITMPSADSQATLIRDTYARAGLDPTKSTDRCQFFEAHGTGTPAGDPQEASAIYKVFFESKDQRLQDSTDVAAKDETKADDVLYVGSIKTVVGHTEGTAGIAGLLKASLAVQNKCIPPNMHFSKLNPNIKPFYGNLKIPVRALEWPDLPSGTPRRCSVNSFGFGGANAHAIIESFEPALHEGAPSPSQLQITEKAASTSPWPFVFSASSEKSLVAQLKSYMDFIDEGPDIELSTLSWSLFRRTAFNFRVAFSATSFKALAVQIEKALGDFEGKKGPLGVRVNPKTSRDILGVFTGQGAQWATMGKELILASPIAASVIDNLERSLSALPDGPAWSLRAEIFATPDKSRIGEAAISQPLCTAIQIMVVDLLSLAGVRFSAVVGHSSGEIACAYVSGFLSATDAVRVAYYRGKFAPLAKGGAMVAAGTDTLDALDLCSLPKLKGRAQLAADNSSASVTISGDADAIDLVEIIMKDESKFARKLKVDTAYHSHHMRVCSDPYLEALNKCDIIISRPSLDAPRWHSSVVRGNCQVTSAMSASLKGPYWRDNMLHPVLFAPALRAAVEISGCPGLVLEVGPHPALKGPATLTIEETTGSDAPYHGTLSRGQNDALAMTSTLGSIWSVLGASDITFQEFQRAFDAKATFALSKALPGFSWDHEKVIWNETRGSKAHRQRATPKHLLLGVRSVFETEGELCWRNYLQPKEMPWLKGHQIQGQIVFPAAGFATMAFEGARSLAPFDTIRSMQLQNFVIHKALSFMDENSSIEHVFKLFNINKAADAIEATFSCYACIGKESLDIGLVADGLLRLELGTPSADALPSRARWADHFVPTQTDLFYKSLADTGYGYTSMFKGITDLQRTNDGSRGVITIPQDEDSTPLTWVIHPAILDVAFQGVFAAVGAPGDGRMWTLHLPTTVESITINPSACELASGGVDVPLPFDAVHHSVEGHVNDIPGDVDVYDEDGLHAIIQVQWLHASPIRKHTVADDRETFAAMTWGLALPDLSEDWTPPTMTIDEEKIAVFAERLSLVILRQLCEAASSEHIESNGTEHQRAILSWAKDVVATTHAGAHATCHRNWLLDTWDLLAPAAERLAVSNPQIRCCLQAKDRLTDLLYNDSSAPTESDVSISQPGDDLYATLPHVGEYTSRLATLVEQITFRHRNLRVLELGTGKSNTTRALLDVLKQNFTSYTYTATSDSGFEEVKASLSPDQLPRVFFESLQIEEDLADQDVAIGAYDLVIAANVVHRAVDIGQTLRNVRSLLRPGGFLAFQEPTNSDSLAIAIRGSVSPSWFSCIENYRVQSPIISQIQWNALLRGAGFSGIDTATPEASVLTTPFSVMCATAEDSQMSIINNPLSFAGKEYMDADLLILGGESIPTLRLVQELKTTLAPFFDEIITLSRLTDLDDSIIDRSPTVISLVELDEPVFKPFTEAKLKAVVRLCDSLKRILWVTKGSRGEDPYMSMMTAVGRCLVGETPTLRLHFLSFDGGARPTSSVLAHHALQVHLTYNISGEPHKTTEPLCTIEREMSYQNSRLLIPRYLPARAINDRINSERRYITRDVELATTVIRAALSNTGFHDGTSYDLMEVPQLLVDADQRKIAVHKSNFAAVLVGNAGCLHVSVGRDVQSGRKVIALSDSLQNVVAVPSVNVAFTDTPDEDNPVLVQSIATELVARSLLSRAPGAVLILNPGPLLAAICQSLACELGKSLLMLSTSPSLAGATYLHSASPDRVVSAALPKDVTTFADLSEDLGLPGKSVLSAKIRKLLPASCTTLDASHLFCRQGFNIGSVQPDVLRQAVISGSNRLSLYHGKIDVLPASRIISLPAPSLGMNVIDWLVDDQLPVIVAPAHDTIRFRGDRTYLLVGLAGQLGLRLTKWMVVRGARHIALASRNPQVDSDWLQDIQADGTAVRTFAMDVTSRKSVQSVCKQVSAEMPEIVGVAQGAMIIIDGLFANKTFADFEKTLKPKVDGTVYLDEFFNKDTLDFFMVFSSLAATAGNVGQSAYATANQFMNSMVANRRMRGLAGSAINMPGIIGLGLLNRHATAAYHLKAAGYDHISEWDFYQFFSEAVFAGRPESGSNFEITAGLTACEVDTMENPPPWTKQARFNPLRKVRTDQGTAASHETSTVSVRAQLADMETEADVHDLLMEGLLDTLYSRLKMNPEERGITPDTAIVELGVDSLLAVDMRAWFTKELDLDMPVLKLLGGATVRDLVEDAVQRLSPALTPKLARADDSANAEAEDGPVEGVDATEDAEAEAEVGEDVAEQATEELPMTIEPLELPSFEDLGASQFKMVIELGESRRQQDDGGASDQSSGSSLAGRTPDTSLPSVSTPGSDVHAVTKGILEHVEPSRGVATLFSPLPTHSDEQPVFVKKVPMSYGASRFWYLSQWVQDPRVFNLITHFKFTGKINQKEAERAVIDLGQRHEAFRTAFFADHENMNEPTMGVLEHTKLHLERRYDATEADFEAEMEELLQYDFKLEQGETFRMKLVSLDDNTHYAVFGFHHIAMDGFSFNIILSDINALYDRAPIDPVRLQYSDYAIRQRAQVTDGTLDEDLQYWRAMYSSQAANGEVVGDFPEPLPLFKVAHGVRQPLDDYGFEEAKLILDTRTARQIRAQCRRHKLTTFHYFLSVLRTFLFRHLDIEDLVIGIADANRIDADIQQTVGFMLNLLPLRFKTADEDADAAFKTIASAVRSKVYEALSHSKVPFDALLEKLSIPRSTTHSPLFQAWMDYKMFQPGYRPKLFGAEVYGAANPGKNGYDLTLEIVEADRNEIHVALRMQKHLYSSSATQRLLDSYMQLVKAFAANFDSPVSSVGLWDPNTIEAVQKLGHGPCVQSTWPETLLERIELIAAERPNDQAVTNSRGKTYTYSDLLEQVHMISVALSAAGVKQGSRVAVFQEPSSDWICSLLAIWHAGGTYLPLDLRNPLPRLASIVEAAKPTVILSHHETHDAVASLGTDAVAMNIGTLESTKVHKKSLANAKTPAVILFTSGSTGTPKGVVLSHSALRNTIEGLVQHYDIGAERVLQQSAYSFDFSLDQILVALTNGGSVYVASKEERMDPVAIANIIKTHNISYTRATPTEYTNWITYGAEHLMESPSWSFAWAGGETMPHSLKQSFAALSLSGLRLYNSYGPAETVTCTKVEIPYGVDDIDDEAEIPVGFPLPNYTVSIVDSRLDLVPQGVAGEILVGGPSVGLGYLNNERLTDEKFVNLGDSGIVYRTGDVGYLRADGALMYQGRVDGDLQVKVRGMRIDLQDIESCVLASAEGALDKAIVSVREGDLLVAHVQFAIGHHHEEDEAKAFLRSLRLTLPLPTHMLPSIIIPLDMMPMSTHGKVDRATIRALGLPQLSSRRGQEALTETEEKLLKIWKEVGLAAAPEAVPVDNQTTFFEMGGNSILLVKLQILISMHFNVKISLLDLFNAVSLGAMSGKIEAAPKADNIDWEAETTLEQDLPKLRQHVAPDSIPARRVLVTGATGFLGRRLVQKLVAADHVEEVHCVAVRSRQSDLNTISDKVKVYAGNLAAPRLGLSDAEIETLTAQVDLIIHAGVSRSVLDSYQTLRGANLCSTKALVKLAAARGIPFHFISTGSLADLDGAAPPTGGSLGYLASKWASEKYLDNAASQLDLPVTIHRIVGSDKAADDTLTTSLVSEHFLSLSETLKVGPTFEGFSSLSLDLIQVDRLTAAIIASTTAAASEDGTNVVEHSCEARLELQSVQRRFAELQSEGQARVPLPRWLARAKKAGLEWQMSSLDNFPLEG